MYALDLSGANVGQPLGYRLLSGAERDTGDDVVTMITHKKNGHVLVRFGKRNAQVDLHPLVEITRVV